MMAATSGLMLFAGFGALSLAMHRHAGQAAPGNKLAPYMRPFRAAGWILLALSLALRLASPNWGIGLVEWLGLAAAAAAGVVLMLLYRPRWLPAAAAIALGAALIALLL